MKLFSLKLTSAVVLDGVIHRAGSIVEVTEPVSRDLLRRGRAVFNTIPEADAKAEDAEAEAAAKAKAEAEAKAVADAAEAEAKLKAEAEAAANKGGKAKK